MKFALASLLLLFYVSFAFAQEVSATQPSTQSFDEGAFRDAINPDTSTWTSAMPNGIAALVGYKTVPVKQSFSHDTNPGDNFLSNANVPGSAGTTSLNDAQFVDFGLRYELPVNNNWSFNVDATGLFAFTSGNGADSSGMNLDDRQNINDPRPAANAAFIYTDSNYGFDVAMGTSFSLSENLYVGALADLSGVFMNNGWDRFSNYQVQVSKLVLILAGGPKLGLRITKNVAIEGSVLFGNNGIGYNGNIVWHF